jgi:hypothetical protein
LRSISLDDPVRPALKMYWTVVLGLGVVSLADH